MLSISPVPDFFSFKILREAAFVILRGFQKIVSSPMNLLFPTLLITYKYKEKLVIFAVTRDHSNVT